MKEPRAAYDRQRWQAKRRGIEWDLTFEQWWRIWEASGKYAERGTRHGQYVMARNWDAGPYAEWNVDIQLSADNVRTFHYRKQYKRARPSAGPLKEHSADPLELLLAEEENTCCNL